MKHIDEYRDPELARRLLSAIHGRAGSIGRTVTLMEVCGSHTHAISRFGLREVLPENLRLLSGPGCPVCVTSTRDVDIALHLAGINGVVFATYGDMMKVPGTGGRTLQKLRAAGADVRVIATARDGIDLAEAHRNRQIVLMGIGFETTAPAMAAVAAACREKAIGNLSIFSVHKVVPPALQALIDDAELAVDGFLCPGHVSSIIGTAPYRPIAEAGKAAVIAGFEPVDVLAGILMALDQIAAGRAEVALQYARGVNPEGNPRALKLLGSVFRPIDADWRGLGTLAASGLVFRPEYASLDAVARFGEPQETSREPKGCGCGEILRGVKTPPQCPLFGNRCTPALPVGPCMVSSEGTCAAWYRYHRSGLEAGPARMNAESKKLRRNSL